jgi:hypothetical protein
MESYTHDEISKEFDKLFLFDVDSFENLDDSLEIDDDNCETQNNELVLIEDEICEKIDACIVYVFYPITVLFLWCSLSYLSYHIMEYTSKSDGWFIKPSLDSCDFMSDSSLIRL